MVRLGPPGSSTGGSSFTITGDVTGGGAGSTSTTSTTTTFEPNSTRSPISIDIPSGSSLLDIRDAINDKEDAGVMAKVIDGQLLLTSKETGAKNSMNIKIEPGTGGSATDLEGLAGDQMKETRKAQDAKFDLDGVTIQRSSNKIDDLFKGITLNLKKVHDVDDLNAASKLSVSVDNKGTKESIKSFIEAYNNFNKLLKELGHRANPLADTSVDENAGQAGPLVKEQALFRQLRADLREALFTTFDTGSDAVQSLTDVGIKTEKGGNLKLDEERFNKVMKKDSEAVINLFSYNVSGLPDGVSLVSAGDKVQNGIYSINIEGQRNAVLQGTDKANFPNLINGVSGKTGRITLSVNGGDEVTIRLSGFSSDATHKAGFLADLQKHINEANDPSSLNSQGNAIALRLNEDGTVSISSQKSGADASLSITGVGGFFANKLGLSTGSSQGQESVSGTIGSFAATGDGSQLEGGVTTNVEGLVLDISSSVGTGDVGSFTFSKGFAYILTESMEKYLATKSKDGIIETRKSDLEDIKTRTKDRLSKVEERSDRAYERLARELQQQDSMLIAMQQAQTQMGAQLGLFY